MQRLPSPLWASVLLLLPLVLFAGDNKTSANSNQMTSQTKLLIMRDLQAERVFVKTVFPRGDKALTLKDGKITPNEQQVAALVAENGFAAKPGDRVVITNIDFKDKAIIVEINGGGKKHQKWYQHVSVGGGGSSTMTPGGAPPSLEAKGSAVILAFDKYVPELTGEQVRQMLEVVFDFKALTEAEAYQKTLPPKVQEAIKNHQVLVGMDRDMVIYAKGRPPKKLRDKDDSGVDYEEWIYGEPPQEVDFVRFQGAFVNRLEIMSVDGQKVIRTEREVEIASKQGQVEETKATPRPNDAPTLRRPGEKPEDETGKSDKPTMYPPAVDTTAPQGMPPGTPPHMLTGQAQ